MTTIQLIRDLHGLEAIELEWKALAGEKLFLSPQWLLNWSREFLEPGTEPFVLTVRNTDGELIGLAPWILRSTSSLGRTIQFMGSGTCCTDHLSILVDEINQQVVLQELAQWLSRANRINDSTGWDLIDLDGCDSNDPVITEFEKLLHHAGHITHCQPTAGVWIVDLSGGWEEYLKRMGYNRRKQTRKLLRAIQSDGYRVERIERPADLNRFMEVLTDLHQRRWNSIGLPGCFADKRFGTFLRNVAHTTLSNGEGYFVILYFQNRPIVAQYSLKNSGGLYSYQIGCEINTDAVATGRLMNIFMLHDVTEMKGKFVDFLRGDEPYKAMFRADAHPTHRLRIVANATLPRLRYQAWLTAYSLKQWARRMLGRDKATVSAGEDKED